MLQATIRVRVERWDITNGKPGDDACCPLAVALRRQFPGRYISVGLSVAYIGVSGEDELRAYRICAAGSCLVGRYDNGLDVVETEVTLTDDGKAVL